MSKLKNWKLKSTNISINDTTRKRCETNAEIYIDKFKNIFENLFESSYCCCCGNVPTRQELESHLNSLGFKLTIKKDGTMVLKYSRYFDIVLDSNTNSIIRAIKLKNILK
jgi:hypothetical protein